MSKEFNRRVQFFPTACGYAASLAVAIALAGSGGAVAQQEVEAGSLCDNVREPQSWPAQSWTSRVS
jgi:hypothetical protein